MSLLGYYLHSKQGIFFVTSTHKTVIKKMSQSFFLCCSVENRRFRQPIFEHGFTVLSNHFGRFAHLDAHFFCHFLEFGRGVGNLFEKNRINPAVFRMFSISSQLISRWLRGFFIFPDSFQFVFGFFILYLWTGCGKPCGQ